MQQNYDITELSDLGSVATELSKELLATDAKEAIVLALYGELGAGKTTFMQTLARELGVEGNITSPTFVVMKKYALPEGGNVHELVHIDAYRIESVDEMRVLGFAELLKQKGIIIGIEWADKIEELLPPQTKHLHFTAEGDKRFLKIK